MISIVSCYTTEFEIIKGVTTVTEEKIIKIIDHINNLE